MLRRFVMGVGIVGMATGAWADPLVFTGVGGAGGWSGAADGRCHVTQNSNSAGGVDRFYWGDSNANVNNCPGTGSQSGYAFDPVNGSLTFDSDYEIFSLGEFSHVNRAIQQGSAITSIDYNLVVEHDAESPQSPFTLFFDIQHDETPNCVNVLFLGCIWPSNVDDIVTVSLIGGGVTFVKDGYSYLFELLGFGTSSSGAFYTHFATAEDKKSSANLYASMTRTEIPEIPQPVPEPASMLLFGTGLAGLAARMRRRNKA